MSAPINLNKARKERARAEKKARADENVVRFGRTKSQKENDRAEKERAHKNLDAHKRET
ncbi:MAG: DUF4169 family protein [Pseudomonadota bacterium]